MPMGQPTTTKASPGETSRANNAHGSPRTIPKPSGKGTSAKPLGQSRADHRYSCSTWPAGPASDSSGFQGAAIAEMPGTGPGKIRSPLRCGRCGPHTKQLGNWCCLKPRKDSEARRASSKAGAVGGDRSSSARLASATSELPWNSRASPSSLSSRRSISSGGGAFSRTVVVPTSLRAVKPHAYPPLPDLGGPWKRRLIRTVSTCIP